MTLQLLRSWLRTFLVQGSFNFDRMVGLGVGYAMEPTLRRLPGGVGGTRYAGAMQRAVVFFNAHPYFSGMAIGAVARAEHEGVPAEQIRRLRHALVGPLGSIGDRLIWAGVLPLVAGVALIVLSRAPAVIAAITFLVLYNVVHVGVRAWAFRAGWSTGTNVARALTQSGIQHGLRHVGPLATVAVGAALPLMAQWLTTDFTMGGRLNVAAVAALGVILCRWIVPAIGGLGYGATAAAVALVVGWVWT